MGSKPITQRAKCNYGKMPTNQEVTVDAGGKKPAKMPSSSPLRQINDSLIQGAGAMGMANVPVAAPEVDKSYLNLSGEFSEDEQQRMANNRAERKERRAEARYERQQKRNQRKEARNNKKIAKRGGFSI